MIPYYYKPLMLGPFDPLLSLLCVLVVLGVVFVNRPVRRPAMNPRHKRMLIAFLIAAAMASAQIAAVAVPKPHPDWPDWLCRMFFIC